MHLFRVALLGALQLLQQSFISVSCFGKKSRAVRVLVCCSPVRFTSLPLRNALASAMTWKGLRRLIFGGQLQDARTVRVQPKLAGYIHHHLKNRTGESDVRL